MENENGYEETLTPQNTETDTDLELDIETDDVDYKSEAEKAKELANNYKIRAEKAEGKLKATIKTEAPSNLKQTDISTTDLYALMKADIAEEDIADVKEYAQLKNISVAEAVKSNIVKLILEEKNEKRNVAQASHTGSSRRGTTTISDDTLLAKASKGELPDSDESIRRLNNLRWGIKG